MTFIQFLLGQVKGGIPRVPVLSVLPLIPFIIAEQPWPVVQAPRFRDYRVNFLISLSMAYFLRHTSKGRRTE